MTKHDWADEVGITTSSLTNQIAVTPGKGQFTLFDLPRIMRDELGMRIIDFNTNTLGSVDRAHIERLRNEIDRAGCIVTNLKLNQFDVDMSSTDASVREHALDVYRQSIDAAAILGARWVRPHPKEEAPDMGHHIDGYRALVDHAANHGLRVVVENYGWMADDPDSVPRLIDAVDRDLAASPDTGSWSNNDVRYAGLARTFPLAVTCDYKAFVMGPDGEHEDYDLQRCFRIGHDAGFRGPWCIEHWHEDTPTLLRELRLLRDMIGTWSST
jgi:hypothetical protein